MNGDKTALPESAVQNITPKWIVSLKENEIFVFGCRNSGRHWDGASAFALKHFGAIMGQREGRQGQSYAIPTIGGVIGLKEIRKSVATFTQYAAEECSFRGNNRNNESYEFSYIGSHNRRYGRLHQRMEEHKDGGFRAVASRQPLHRRYGYDTCCCRVADD